MLSIPKQSVSRSREVIFVRIKDIGNVLLRIAIDKREPATLNVDHESVPRLERMKNVTQFQLD